MPGPPEKNLKSPLLEQGWLRVLLFGVCFLLLTLVIAIPVLLLVADKNLDEIMAAPLHLITSLLSGEYLWLVILLEWTVSLASVLIFRVFVDRRSIISLGLRLTGHTGEAAAGFLTGTALLGLGSMILVLTSHFRWTDINPDTPALLQTLLLMIVIAFSEELVFRGYILQNLMESFKPWTALVISAVLFASFHITNPSIGPMAMANLALAGVLMGLNYIYTRNLWFSILLHFSWNFFQGSLLGFRVSGLNLPSVLLGETRGDTLLTGGDFGLEGSVLITAILLIAILLLNLVFGQRYSTKG